MTRLSPQQARLWFADRQTQGFNAAIVSLIGATANEIAKQVVLLIQSTSRKKSEAKVLSTPQDAPPSCVLSPTWSPTTTQ
jgi:hypothetical protein